MERDGGGKSRLEGSLDAAELQASRKEEAEVESGSHVFLGWLRALSGHRS